jgi:hypothetical protein
MSNVKIGLLVLVLLFQASLSFADPVSGYEPNGLPEGYGSLSYGMSSDYNSGDLVFIQPYPDPSTLTAEEKYMIAGAHNAERRVMRPWYQEICQMASAYYQNTGVFPSVIDAEVIREVAGDPGSITEESLDLFRSPITGEFSRLDSKQFSPGDLYLHPLSESEKLYIASRDESYRLKWYENQYFDTCGNLVPIKMLDQPIYYRVYGHNGIVLTGIFQTWTFI